MVYFPIWSTWARYKKEVNTDVVLKFAKEIQDNKFKDSQLEIDDNWESCYGALTFDTKKFPNIKNTIKELKDKGFRVTVWTHPFINTECEPWYSEAKNKGYFVKDHNNNTDTQWWDSQNHAGYIDYSKTAAAEWYLSRLRKLQTETGVDSFKFDAGESTYPPADPILNGSISQHPSIITTEYVKTVAQMGGMIEVRVGQNNQDLPIFTRMLDKDSQWTLQSGLASLITSLLQVTPNNIVLESYEKIKRFFD